MGGRGGVCLALLPAQRGEDCQVGLKKVKIFDRLSLNPRVQEVRPAAAAASATLAS